MATTMVRPWLGMAGLLLGLLLAACSGKPPQVPQATAEAPAVASAQDPTLLAALQQLLDKHRRIIVLLADEEQQSAADRGTSTRVGQQLFHDGLEQRTAIAAQFDTLLRGSSPQRFATLGTVLDYIESAQIVGAVTSLLNIARGADHWVAWSGDAAEPAWTAGHELAVRPVLVLATSLVAAAGFLGLA